MSIDLITATPSPLDLIDKLNTVSENIDTSAPLSSPAFTGTPTAPTATSGTNTTQIATTAFVNTAVANKTTISGNAGTATKLTTPQQIDGVSFNGTADITHYGTCSTDAATAAKTVTLTGFTLVTGAHVLVKFTVTNTATNPTLNVNSTGAKAIMYRGSAISAGYLAANRVYEFVYDGTNYEFVGDYNTNTTYSTMTGATSSAAGKAGLVPAPSAGSQTKLLRGDGSWVAINSGGISLSSSTTVTASTESAKSYIYTCYGLGSRGYNGRVNVTGASSWNTSGSGADATYKVSFNEVSGIAAGTYTLQNLLQTLAARSHTHTTKLVGSLGDCNCDCTDAA